MRPPFHLLILFFFFSSSLFSEQRNPKSVLIVGGGSIGLYTAKYASELGHKVTLIEKGLIAKGASTGNTGHIVPSIGAPIADPSAVFQRMKEAFWDGDSVVRLQFQWNRAYMKWLYHHLTSCTTAKFQRSSDLLFSLGKESRRLYQEIVDEGQVGPFFPQGRLELFHTASGFSAKKKELPLLREKSVTATLVNQEELGNYISFVKLPLVTGAIHYPEDAFLSPSSFLLGVAEALASHNVEIREHTEVIGFETDGANIIGVKTTQGLLTADEYVIAAGHETPGLAEKLNIHNVLIQPGAGYSLTITDFDPLPTTSLMFHDEHITATPMGKDLRFASFIVLGDRNPKLDPEIINSLKAKISHLMDIDFTTISDDRITIWKGFRPCSPDGLPSVGRHSKYDNLIIASGHGTLGIHLGPITGKLVSELIDNRPTSLEISALSPNRF